MVENDGRSCDSYKSYDPEETCPRCNSKITSLSNDVRDEFGCGTQVYRMNTANHRIGDIAEDEQCVRNQLTDKDTLLRELAEAAEELILLVDDALSSNRGSLCLQNYARLNDAPINARRAIAKAKEAIGDGKD